MKRCPVKTGRYRRDQQPSKRDFIRFDRAALAWQGGGRGTVAGRRPRKPGQPAENHADQAAGRMSFLAGPAAGRADIARPVWYYAILAQFPAAPITFISLVSIFPYYF
jgi:hypothetical protein